MKMVKVYKFMGYDFQSDTPIESRRWATKEFIESRKYGIAEGTEISVLESDLDHFGLTRRNYKHDSVLGESGFQTRVERY